MMISLTFGYIIIKHEDTKREGVINLWRKTHTLACGIKATFHLINTLKNDI